MRKLQFIEARDFDYGAGTVTHEAGDTVAVHEGGDAFEADKAGKVTSLRSDKAQRWVTRKAAAFLDAKGKPEAAVDAAQVNERTGEGQTPAAAATNPEGQANDNAVASAAPVAAKKRGGAGKGAKSAAGGGGRGAGSRAPRGRRQ